MKHLSLIFILSAGITNCFAQTGNVGIGTTSPQTKLHVYGNGLFQIPPPIGSVQSYGLAIRPTVGNSPTGYAPLLLQNTNDNNVFKIQQEWGANDRSIFFVTDNYDNGATEGPRMAIDRLTGNVGINTLTPRTRLDVNGALSVVSGPAPNSINMTYIAFNSLRPGIGESEFVNYRGTGTGGFRFYSIPNIGTPGYPANYIAFIESATGQYFQVSDARAKSNISPVENALSSVLTLNPVTYDMQNKRSIGFIAQELYKVVPEAVDKPKDEANELYTVSYTTIVPLLTKAIQEQQEQIERLTEEVSALKQIMNKKKRSKKTATATTYAAGENDF